MLLARLADSPPDDDLIDALLLLEPSPDDSRRALATLLAWLADPEYVPLDRMNFRTWERVSVTDALARLGATAEDTRQARRALLDRLASEERVPAELVATLIRLDPAPHARREVLDAALDLLVSRVTAFAAGSLAEAVLDLAQSEEDKRHVLGTLIRHLSRRENMNPAAQRLIVKLEPGPADKRRVLDVLLVLLARTTGPDPADLADLVARLDPTADDKHQACQMLVEQLTARVRDMETETKVTADLVAALLRLDPTPDDKRLAREALLLGLPSLGADAIRSQVRELVVLLFGKNSSRAPAADLAAALLQLDPTPGDKRRARRILLGLLSGQGRSGQAAELAATVAQLDPEPDDKRHVRDMILGRLGEDTHGLYAERLAGALAQLDPAPGDKRQACRTLIGLLRGEAASSAAEVMAGLSRLDATPDDMRQAREAAREALLMEIGSGPRATVYEGGRPRRPPHGTVANEVKAVLQVASTPDDRRQALDGLLGLVAHETDSHVAAELIDGATKLDPTARDLSAWPIWAAPPTAELLAAARRNSSLDDWLAVLPSLRCPRCANSPRDPVPSARCDPPIADLRDRRCQAWRHLRLSR